MGKTDLKVVKTYLPQEMFDALEVKIASDGTTQAKYLRGLIARNLKIKAPNLEQGRPKKEEEGT